MTESKPYPGLKTKHNQASAIVAEMTLDEKAAFCSGKNFWQLEDCERLDLPAVMITDGPHGLRKQVGNADHIGLNDSVPATCFPTASSLASSWDTLLIHEVGVALGEQCVAENVTVLLGPGVNIKRHPLCGRNFEYFSEDPFLTGTLAAAMIQGVQSQGVGTSIKHYAVNNQEDGRMFVNAIVDERTLREIYLRGFEIAVKQAQPWTVMCAYNRVNGVYCSENDFLLNQVLRDEWGFEGLVVTDWGAANDRVRGIAAGLDLEMPASGGINDRRVADAVQIGTLSEAELDRNVIRNVSMILMGADLAATEIELDQNSHHRLARKAAAESSVLLKNSAGLLPLQPSGHIEVIGAFAKHPRYQGAGSSQVTPTQLPCAYDAISAAIVDDSTLTYTPGYDAVHSELAPELIEKATNAAQVADVVILFAGLPATFESEGFDRSHLNLPEQHNLLIEAVCAANPNTVVVLSNGAPIAMPWIGSASAILECYLAGQAGGEAVADLLFGKANPSGKLAETFPLQLSDVPANQWFPGSGRQVHYREGLFVGYRYFDTSNKQVLFPFGFGLSYTRFEYSDLALSESTLHQGDEFSVRFNVKNTGERVGAEVTQLYVSDIDSSVYRSEQELKAYAKVTLEPGETRRLTLRLDDRAFAIYDTGAHGWVVESGEFEIRIGASSKDIRLKQVVVVVSQQRVSSGIQDSIGPDASKDKFEVPDDVFASMLDRPVPLPEFPRPFHINSSLNEISETWLGRKLKAQVVASFEKTMDVTQESDTHKKMFEEMANNMPLRALVLFGGGLSFRLLGVFVAILNKQFFTALRQMIKPDTKF